MSDAIAANNQSRYYVYVLFDWTGTPRYVGKGRGRRIDDHLRPDRSGNRAKRALIAKTIAILGDLPRVKVREALTEAEAFEVEVALISALGRLDLKTGPLTNMSEGGTGGDHGASIRKIKALWTPAERARHADTYRQISKAAWKRLDDAEKESRAKRLVAASAAARGDPSVEARRSQAISDGHGRRTPDQKAEAARKALITNSPENRSRTATTFHASQTSEERRSRVVGKLTPEQRSERARRINANTAPEVRSARICLQQANLTPAQKAARAQKAGRLGTGTRWITDGTTEVRHKADALLPEGWRYGRLRGIAGRRPA